MSAANVIVSTVQHLTKRTIQGTVVFFFFEGVRERGSLSKKNFSRDWCFYTGNVSVSTLLQTHQSRNSGRRWILSKSLMNSSIAKEKCDCLKRVCSCACVPYTYPGRPGGTLLSWTDLWRWNGSRFGWRSLKAKTRLRGDKKRREFCNVSVHHSIWVTIKPSVYHKTSWVQPVLKRPLIFKYHLMKE